MEHDGFQFQLNNWHVEPASTTTTADNFNPDAPVHTAAFTPRQAGSMSLASFTDNGLDYARNIQRTIVRPAAQPAPQAVQQPVETPHTEETASLQLSQPAPQAQAAVFTPPAASVMDAPAAAPTPEKYPDHIKTVEVKDGAQHITLKAAAIIRRDGSVSQEKAESRVILDQDKDTTTCVGHMTSSACDIMIKQIIKLAKAGRTVHIEGPHAEAVMRATLAYLAENPNATTKPVKFDKASWKAAGLKPKDFSNGAPRPTGSPAPSKSNAGNSVLALA
jgi:hypothetical protein